MFTQNFVVLSIFGWSLFILGIKHTAYILVYGSIFESLRESLRKVADTEGLTGWVFQKISGLFSCNLCMITQLTFWMLILPLFYFMYSLSWFNIVLGAFIEAGIDKVAAVICIAAAYFIFWMSTASLSMWYWNLSEFRLERFQKQKDYYEELLSRVARGVSPTIVGMQSLENLLSFIDQKCSDIDCMYRRSDCAYDTMRAWVKDNPPYEGAPEGELPSSVKKAIKWAYLDRRTNKQNAADIFREISKDL